MTATAGPRRSDLGVRTVTGVVLIGVANACLVLGSHGWWALVLGAALLMLVEWAGMIRAERWQLWLAMLGLVLSLTLEEPSADAPDDAGLLALLGCAALVLLVTRRPRLAAGMLYAGLPSLALLFLHDRYDGVDLTLWTLATVWATDIGAYFAGRRVGGPKLAPRLSPNKTWAGLIGGIVSAEVGGLVLARLLHLPLRLAACAGLLAIAAQAGDLYESAMKRRAGVKDSGRVLPGHGGVMDRLDGVVPVACLVAAMVAAGVI